MKTLTSVDLATLEDGFPVPFQLSLGTYPQSSSWEVLAILRLLPGRRVVLEARNSDEGAPIPAPNSEEAPAPSRILKLFIGPGRDRYCDRERRGLAWLAEAHLPVVQVLGHLQDREASGLIIDYLPGADVVQSGDQSAAVGVAALLGRMHDAGLWQEDLHLQNFMVSSDQLWAIDGDGVKRRADPLSRGRGLLDLALLAAQRSPSEDEGAPGLLTEYCAVRGWHDRPGDDEFRQKLDQARRRRMRRYLKKTLRDCGEFMVSDDGGFRFYAVRGPGVRVLESVRAAGLLSSGEEFLDSEAVKRGNSATLVRAQAAQPVVIKRYNIKNLQQGLRRMLRPTPRFRRAWMMGRLLNLLDLPTARPLALVEGRRRFLPGVAYLVMEDLGGRDLATEIAEGGLSAARCNELVTLFLYLKRAGLTHGDTKATNFLIHDDRVHLIDLDAMHLGLRGFDQDIRRFLDNWKTAERQQFEAAFGQAGLL